MNGFCDVLGMEIDGGEKGLIENFIRCQFSRSVKFENGKKIFKDRDRCVLNLCGVDGVWRIIDSKNKLGSTAFNEGITAYKMKNLTRLLVKEV